MSDFAPHGWWQCVYDLQTLIAGLLAFCGGGFVLFSTQMQLRDQRRARQDELRAKTQQAATDLATRTFRVTEAIEFLEAVNLPFVFAKEFAQEDFRQVAKLSGPSAMSACNDLRDAIDRSRTLTAGLDVRHGHVIIHATEYASSILRVLFEMMADAARHYEDGKAIPAYCFENTREALFDLNRVTVYLRVLGLEAMGDPIHPKALKAGIEFAEAEFSREE